MHGIREPLVTSHPIENGESDILAVQSSSGCSIEGCIRQVPLYTTNTSINLYETGKIVQVFHFQRLAGMG